MLGFSYNGKHCEEMHVHFIPKETQRGDLMSDYETIDDDRAWFDGGDYYKSRVKPREFSLPCFYEDITRKELEDIVKWLDRRTVGYLIFDDRPYARYYVRPTKQVAFKNYGIDYGSRRVYSGTFTITLKAFWPFAELINTTSDAAPVEAFNEVDLLSSDEMPGVDAKSVSSLLVYNPGTELGQSYIEFMGTASTNGLVITNTTNGDKCTLKSPADGDQLNVDSKKGRVENVSGSTVTLDYSKHNDGYIHFEPNRILVNSISVGQTSGSKVITSSYAFKPEYVGTYIWMDNTWKLIDTYTSPSSMKVSTNASETKTVRTKIVTMNKLTITGRTSATKLNIYCRPEVR